MDDDGPVPTGVAARALGIDVRTFRRWAAAGIVTPEYVTPGGHARWDVDKVREQLRARRRREE